MSMKKYVGTVLAALLIGLSGSLHRSSAEGGKSIDQMIAEAHTARVWHHCVMQTLHILRPPSLYLLHTLLLV
jgi:hypothetical protein